MKIAFDYQIFSQQRFGGISRYYSSLIRELIKLNQEVNVYAGFYKNNFLKSLSNEFVKGHYLKKYPPKTGKVFNLINNLWSYNQINSSNSNLVHQTYYSNNAKINKKVPIVVTALDMIHELYPEENDDNSIYQRKKNTFKRADHIICISNNTKDDLVNIYGVYPEKISVTYLASNDWTNVCFQNIDNDIHSPYILYVGERSGYKNFSSLIKAFASSKYLRNDFNIITFGGKRFNKSELGFIESFGLLKNVKQRFGDDSVLASMYSGASALIYPSLYEGFGIPPLEAMAFNCPVIASNTSSIPEVVGIAGEYFNPTDIEDIKNAIENVVFSPSRIADLKYKGLDRVKEFSWRKCATETLEIYQKISR